MSKIIELSWGFSTVLGILLFLGGSSTRKIVQNSLPSRFQDAYFCIGNKKFDWHNFPFPVEIAILIWVKFYGFSSHAAAWVATALLIPIICIFIAFAAHFYMRVIIVLKLRGSGGREGGGEDMFELYRAISRSRTKLQFHYYLLLSLHAEMIDVLCHGWTNWTNYGEANRTSMIKRVLDRGGLQKSILPFW